MNHIDLEKQIKREYSRYTGMVPSLREAMEQNDIELIAHYEKLLNQTLDTIDLLGRRKVEELRSHLEAKGKELLERKVESWPISEGF